MSRKKGQQREKSFGPNHPDAVILVGMQIGEGRVEPMESRLPERGRFRRAGEDAAEDPITRYTICSRKAGGTVALCLSSLPFYFRKVRK